MNYSRWYHNGMVWTALAAVLVAGLWLAERQVSARSELPMVIAVGVPESAGEDAGEDPAGQQQRFDTVVQLRAAAGKVVADTTTTAGVLVVLARQARDFRDYPLADSLLLAALKKQPEDIETLFLRGRTQSDLNNTDEAEKLYRTVLARAPNHQKANFNLALLLRDRGDAVAAEHALRHTIDISSGRLKGKALYQLGLLRLQGGKTPEAAALFRQAIALRPEQDSYWLGLGEALRAQGLLQEAGKALEKALALDKDSPDTLLALAHVEQDRGNERAAMRHIKRAFRFDPAHRDVREEMAWQYMARGDAVKAQEHYRWLHEHAVTGSDRVFFGGMLAFLDQNEPRMRDLLQKADRKNPGHYDRSLLRLATLLQGQKQYDSAWVLFDSLLQRSPGSPQLLVAAGETALKRGRPAEAEVLIRRALVNDANNASAWFLLARVQSTLKKNGDAIDSYRRNIALDPHARNARLNLAVLLSREHRENEALQIYDALLKDHPRYVPGLLNRARLYERRKQYTAARDDLQKALKVSPNEAELKVRLAGVLLLLKEPKKAKNMLLEAIAEVPEDPDVRLLLADAEMSLGNPEEAKTQWRFVLKLEPDNIKARQRLLEYKQVNP